MSLFQLNRGNNPPWRSLTHPHGLTSACANGKTKHSSRLAFSECGGTVGMDHTGPALVSPWESSLFPVLLCSSHRMLLFHFLRQHHPEGLTSSSQGLPSPHTTHATGFWGLGHIRKLYSPDSETGHVTLGFRKASVLFSKAPKPLHGRQ